MPVNVFLTLLFYEDIRYYFLWRLGWQRLEFK